MVPMVAHGYLCDVRVTTYHSAHRTGNTLYNTTTLFILTIKNSSKCQLLSPFINTLILTILHLLTPTTLVMEKILG